MKRLFGAFVWVCLGVLPVCAQSVSWEPTEMEKVSELSWNSVSKFSREERRAYLNFTDLMEEVTTQLQEIVLFPAEQEKADPKSMEQVTALFLQLAQAYEKLHQTYPQAARVASVDLVFRKFVAYDLELGYGIEVYEQWPSNIKDKEAIALYQRVFQHLCANYDSFLK